MSTRGFDFPECSAPNNRVDSSLGELSSPFGALLRPRQEDSGHLPVFAWICDPPVPCVRLVTPHEEVEIVDL